MTHATFFLIAFIVTLVSFLGMTYAYFMQYKITQDWRRMYYDHKRDWQRNADKWKMLWKCERDANRTPFDRETR